MHLTDARIDLFAPRGRYQHLPSIADGIDASGDCWEWTRAKDHDGYGQVFVSHRMVRVHRLMWEALVGPIPVNHQMDHLCRNEGCCNPDHLEPVTASVNNRRKPFRPNANSRKTHCKHGHPFDGANTYIRANGRRTCRECGRASWRAWDKRREDKRNAR